MSVGFIIAGLSGPVPAWIFWFLVVLTIALLPFDIAPKFYMFAKSRKPPVDENPSVGKWWRSRPLLHAYWEDALRLCNYDRTKLNLLDLGHRKDPVFIFVLLVIKGILTGNHLFSRQKPSEPIKQRPEITNNTNVDSRPPQIAAYIDNTMILPLAPPPTPEEYHEALINPWPGHTPEETIARNRGKES